MSDLYSCGRLSKIEGSAETSKDYRQSLYEKARIEIDKTLQSLLGRFHEGILQVVAPNKGQPQSHSSSLKITAPEKYERLVLKIYQPLSLHKITRSTVDETGKHFIYVSTLEERMEQYSEQLAKRAKYLKQLQREWEVVVGKIWNLGIECLGEEMMETLFLSGNLGPAPDVTSALFISEQDISSSSSPLQDPIVITSKPNKKHVTIEAPEGYVSTPTTNHPVLLYQSSSRSAKKKMKKKKNEGDAQVKHQHGHQTKTQKNKSILSSPKIAPDVLADLGALITTLGTDQLRAMQDLAREHERYWKRKNALVAQALRSE